MNVTIISSLFTPYQVGGSEEQPAQLARCFQRMGHQVNVVSTCRAADLKGKDYRKDSWEGIPVWRIAPWNVYWLYDSLKQNIEVNNVQRLAWHAIDLWNPTVIRPLKTVLELIKPNVVNTHNINGLSSAVWSVAARFARSVFHTLHDYHLLCYRGLRRRHDETCTDLCSSCKVYSQFRRSHEQHVAGFIAPSIAVGRELTCVGWNTPVHVVRNAVETEPFTLPKSDPLAPLNILFLARLDPEKGCETLLSTIERFKGRTDVHFHIAGRGVFARQFQDLSTTMANYTWHGFVQGHEKRQLLLQADAFLQLSEWLENAPLALLEARHYGLYLVGTEIGGIPELITVPDNGVLIRPKDKDGLGIALDNLIARRHLLRAHRTTRVHAQPHYGLQEMAAGYLDVFSAERPLDARDGDTTTTPMNIASPLHHVGVSQAHE